MKNKFKFLMYGLTAFIVSCENDTLKTEDTRVEATNIIIKTELEPSVDDGGLPRTPSTLVDQLVSFESVTDENLITGREWLVDNGYDGGNITFDKIPDVKKLEYTFKSENNDNTDRTKGGFGVTLREFFKDGKISRQLVKMVVRKPVVAKMEINPDLATVNNVVTYNIKSELSGISTADQKPAQNNIIWIFEGGIVEGTKSNNITTKNINEKIKVSYPKPGKYRISLSLSREWPSKSTGINIGRVVDIVPFKLMVVNNVDLIDNGNKLAIEFDTDLKEPEASVLNNFNVTYTLNEKTEKFKLNSLMIDPSNPKILILDLDGNFTSNISSGLLSFNDGVLNAADDSSKSIRINKSFKNPLANLYLNTVYDHENQNVGATIAYEFSEPLAEGASYVITDEDVRPGSLGKKSGKFVQIPEAGAVIARGEKEFKVEGPGTYQISYWGKASKTLPVNSFISTEDLGDNKPGFWKQLSTEWTKYTSDEFKLKKEQVIKFDQLFNNNNQPTGFTAFIDDIELIRIGDL